MALDNGTPHAYHNGISDESGATPLPQELELPQHLPLLHCQLQRGRVKPYPLSGVQLNKMYGADSFNERKKWFSHQTQALMIANGNANVAMVKRVLGTGAAKATLRLSLQTGEDVFKPYVRDSEGVVARDGDGTRQRNAAGADVTGLLCTWLVTEVTANTFGLATVTTGAAYGSEGESANIYPIMDLEIDSEGEYGNNTCARLWYPHAGVEVPGDLTTMATEETNIYRIQFAERATATSTPKIIQTMDDGKFVDFASVKGILSAANRAYEPTDVVQAYQRIIPGYVPEYGPAGRTHFYNNHFTTVTEIIQALEDIAHSVNTSTAERINIMDGIDPTGIDYYSFYMDENGRSLNENTNLWFTGGADGTVSEAELDTQVRADLGDWENVDLPLVDHAQFPFSILYDTGFSLATKEAMLATLGMRDDISVTACTQDLALAENDIATERTMGSSLRTAARLTPESTVHGTETVRATITGQMGKLTSSLYGRRLPLVLDLLDKRSKYMGASNGAFKAKEAYDITPNNRVTTMTEISHPYKSNPNRDIDWDNGVNYVQHSKMNEMFWPAYQTVYSDDTSIINSDINMLIAVDLKKKQRYLWTEFTGRSDLTRAQFIEKHDERFLELVFGKYNGRVRIESNTFFTAADKNRNYSWSHAANMYGNGSKTVASLDVITRREEE